MVSARPTNPTLHFDAAPAAPAAPVWRKLARHGLIAIAFNSGIATALSIAGQASFAHNMVYSQLIGLIIWLLIDGGRHIMHPQGHISAARAALMTLGGGLAGYFLGSALGDLVLGHPVLSGWNKAPYAMAGFMLMSLFAAALGVFFFMSRELLAIERNKLEQVQRQATEAQLKLLQSQLDPHMLFNTFANLRVLIQSEPDRAVQMLDQLNDFLRATLSASRASEHSLAAEFDRLHDYLALMQIRMGERLKYVLELPPDLAQAQVPALILQSLVENAVLHGLEPKVQGGQVRVSAAREGGNLVLQVQDDGLGFDAGLLGATQPEGFGLTQVRERLRSRYGDSATIDLIASCARSITGKGLNDAKNTALNDAPGCRVTLRIPVPV